MQLSSSEKLILVMLSEIYEHLGVKGEIDPKFVKGALYDDYTWALTWKHPGLFSGGAETPLLVKHVMDILEMWSWLKRGYKKLSDEEKELVKEKAAPFGDKVRFPGFDGNNEAEYITTAQVLTKHFDRFTELKGRIPSSYGMTLEIYDRMLSPFRKIRESQQDSLTAAQIIEILKEQTYPDKRHQTDDDLEEDD